MNATEALRKFKAVMDSIRGSYTHQRANVFGEVSPLWATFLRARTPAAEFNDFAAFLSDTSAATTGAAGKYSDADKSRLASYHRNWIEPELLDRFPLSMVGQPTIFEYEGRACNTAYLENLSYLQDLERLIAPHLALEGLRIAEIGAGYGGVAELLIRSGAAASYTIIDLPENLELSAFHLTQSFPDLPYRALSHGEKADDFEGLTFLTPGNIEALADQQFDLVINTDSLGEMPARTARAYVTWIAQHLRPGGCFFSKNGHRRSSTGVQRVSEYGYDQLRLLEMEPIKTPSTVFADHSHLMLFTQGAAKDVEWSRVDTLCDLYALGLHDELKATSKALARGCLSLAQEKFLTDAAGFIDEPRMFRKAVRLQKYGEADISACASYLRGLSVFLAGAKDAAAIELTNYLAYAESPVAEAIALFLLRQTNDAAFDGPFRGAGKTAFMISELRKLEGHGWPLDRAGFALRNDLIRKKLQTADDYRPSALLMAKNIALNLREGKGLRVERH